MSVYTQLSEEQFTKFCHDFGVNFANAIPIAQGVKNSNWFIQTTDDVHNDKKYSYVLTLFEERPPEDVKKMAVILNKLKSDLPVAPPLATTSTTASDDDALNNYLIIHEGKAVTLVPCLSGSHPTRSTANMCEDMGKALAILHKTLQTLTPSEDYGVPLYPWHEVRDREIQTMSEEDSALMRDIWASYDNLPLSDNDKLPQGLCHLDLFADNTLWDLSETPKLTGMLDFTEVSVEHYVMDIAITINDFCTVWGNGEQEKEVDFSLDKMTAFLQGYESERTLTDAEHHALPIMLSMAGVTFWLLRLNVIHYNRVGGRTGDDIMVKNPDLMKKLAALQYAQVK